MRPNPDKDKITRARYRAKNKSKHQDWIKKWKARNPIKTREYNLKKYGLTTHDFNLLLQAQNGICALCGKLPGGGYNCLCVDHDHDTGRVRGLLCNNCNRGLGLLRDSKELLKKAIDYL